MGSVFYCFMAQSSIYPHRIHAVAGYAVDGNTDGEFLNSSTTHLTNVPIKQ
jgi:hypothetical protein